MAEYTIDQGAGVRERMDLLADFYRATTVSLLDRVGVAPGARCLDVGCGGGHVTTELARRVGPSGYVLGLDLDEGLLGIAAKDAANENLNQVEYRVGNAEELAESGFDLAYARCLLMHTADPQRVVAAMAGALRPGGFVVLEDCHFASCFTSPPCTAYELLVRWYPETVRRRGGDPDIGPKLPVLLAAAGLECQGVSAVQPAHCDGRHKRLMQVSMGKVRNAVVGTGVADPDEFDRVHADLIAFTENPTTLIAGPRLVQAWARA